MSGTSAKSAEVSLFDELEAIKKQCSSVLVSF